MLTIAVIGTPLVQGYKYFVYKTFTGKVKLDEHSY
jgi:cytochrome d ubiquinol oxidase subunit II